MKPRILIVGAGAIGGVTAARMAHAGHDVAVLDADEAHVARMRQTGLKVDAPDGPITVVLDAYRSPDAITGRFDYALLMLKSTALEPALASLLSHELADTYVVFGNGLVQDIVEKMVGRGRMLVGITEWGATNRGPGHVEQTTVAPFIIGELDGESSSRANDLVGPLSSVAEVQVSDSVQDTVWTKLLLNSTFSGLGAVAGWTYREVAADEQGLLTALRLWTEAYDVALARGARLQPLLGVDPQQLVVRTVDDHVAASAGVDAVMQHLGATKASMLQDLERGARTEAGVINGGVVATGESLGVPTPGHRAVVEWIHRCEQGTARPGRAGLAHVAKSVGVV
ncbi:ketopantoate reductase family protein [Streptomyces sp. NPDC002795]|uniref:ketopantoate reductase family protein n=1 Tax=Streptomyces sp. NPDC002795 TaxID=3364665 RepID=UPI0036B9B8C3